MTKIITLTRGFKAMVDDEDYEWLNQWKWSATQNGYAYRRGPMNIYMHNAIMKNTSGTEVDHVHGIAFDNRKSELRICTHAENCANGKIRNTNTSGYKGVSWHKQTGKWRAYIVKSNKQTSLGLFDNVIDAIDSGGFGRALDGNDEEPFKGGPGPCRHKRRNSHNTFQVKFSACRSI